MNADKLLKSKSKINQLLISLYPIFIMEYAYTFRYTKIFSYYKIMLIFCYWVVLIHHSHKNIKKIKLIKGNSNLELT